MKLFLLTLTAAFLASPILLQDPIPGSDSENSQQQETSENAEPQNAKEIIASWESKRTQLETEHHARLIELDESTIERLVQLARQLASDGKIADAKETWIELLKLDPNNPDGKEFCEALGIWAQVKKQLGKLRTTKSKTYDRIEYQCASGRVFKKQSNGLWSDTNFPVTYREAGRNEYAVTIVAMTADADVHVLLPDHFQFAKGRDWKKGQRYRGEDGGWVR